MKAIVKCLYYTGLFIAFVTSSQGGVIAHWTMDDTSVEMLYNAAGSGHPVDATGNTTGGFATYSSGGSPDQYYVQSVAGKIGTAADFGALDSNGSGDGHNGYAQVALGGILDHSTDTTTSMGAWFKLNAIDSGDAFPNWLFVDGNSFGLGVRDDKLEVTYYNGGWSHLASSFTLSLDTWYYGAAVRDNTSLSVLLIEENGTVTTDSTTIGGIGAAIGGSYIGGSVFNDNFGGIIDDVKLFDEALDESGVLNAAFAAVPEPSSMMLVLIGFGAIMMRAFRRYSHVSTQS